MPLPYPDYVNTIMTYATLAFIGLGAAAFLAICGAALWVSWMTFRGV